MSGNNNRTPGCSTQAATAVPPSRLASSETYSGKLGLVARQIFHQQWAHSDETHLAAHHIPQRRQFIERRATEERPECREALRVGARAVAHRAELEQLEQLAVKAGPAMTKPDRRAEVRTRRDANRSNQRQRNPECWYREHEIESTFADCTVGAVEQAGRVAQHRHQEALRR
jgi:hypothetical protein